MARSKSGGNGVRYRGGGYYTLPGGEVVRGKAAVAVALSKPIRQEVHMEMRAVDVDAMASYLAGNKLPSELTGRLNFLRQAGLLYKGIRDIYTSAGYIQEGSETFDNYWSLYERDPVAGRIVDMPAKTTWKTPPEVFEGTEEERDPERVTDFEKDWAALAKRLKVWRHFERVDRLSRIGRYAVLLIGVKDVEDSALDKEMPMLAGHESVLYLTSYAEKYASIVTWEKDPRNPRFGLPLSYQLSLASGVKEFGSGEAKVHWTRVIHVAEDPLVDDVFGRPVLKRVLNPLADLLKVTAATGEAYWQMAVRILQAKIDPQMELDPKDVEKMGEKIEELVHDLRRQFTGQGVELQWLPGTEPKPGDALEVYKSLMGVGSGIPTRVLFGSEMGQLASSQDERNYFGMVNERQEQHAEPDILRAFIDRLVDHGGLSAPKKEEGYTVIWPTLFEQTEKEIAESNLARAKTAKELTAMGGDPRTLVEVDEDRNVWLLPDAVLEVLKEEAEAEEEAARALEDAEAEEAEEELLLEVDEEGMDEALLENLVVNQTKVQTLIFPKKHWDSQASVKKWARDHDFKASVDETDVSYRLRQRPPSQFTRMRTICLKGAKQPTSAKCTIKAVIGPLKATR